ncbi:hypothetical protein [Pseudonocardia endophytica]|uniref:Uncharacterized protein n=1 Tax=Pseudonocardia endophytica TaxID=401976 RepID=A0A4R1HZX7_PSEEN|nr:hypothetical protein [Pseudonocardia endophytica]TCK27143.1 hypothetical protein EV378_3002 [Pseudonocardia endophytica]
MIDVNSTGRRPDRYALHRGRHLLGTVTLGARTSGGAVEVDGVAYEVRAGTARGAYDLVAADGSVAAAAERVHRRTWSLRTADGTRWFRRDRLGGAESLTGADGRALGRVTRSRLRGAAVDLPGLDLPVQAFALTLVLMRRRRRRRVATRTTAVSVIGR